MISSTFNTGKRLAGVLLLSLLVTGSIAHFTSDASASASHNAPATVAAARVAPRPMPLLSVVDQPDILPRHKTLADRILRMLPPQCRRSLKNFYVRYEGTDRRGYGGKTTIVLDGNVPDEEFTALLIHECGHVIHANLAGTSRSGVSEFRDGRDAFYNNAPVLRYFRISWEQENVLRAGAASTEFASGYGKSDVFEDFAEFFVAYVLHPQMLRERSKTDADIAAKFAWMREVLPLRGGAIATSAVAWTGNIPWDMTKLPVELLETLNPLTASVR